MIELLRIQNLALVESIELEFGPGLNVLTGETGAGKSIILNALALLGGARPPADALRSGASEGVVEALFRMDGHPELAAVLAERDLVAEGREPSDGNAADVPAELIVRRTLHAGGRSRARIGGQLVPIATLAEIFGGQLEISSQHGSQALRDADTHALALDAYAGQTAVRGIVAREVSRVGRLDREIAALRTAETERVQRLDFLRYQLGELDAEELDVDDVAKLEAEHRRLTHGERLAEEMGRVAAALGGDGAEEETSAEAALGVARRGLAAATRMDPTLDALGQRLESVAAELGDLALAAADYLADLEIDPARLARVEEQIGRLERLRRKYGQSVEAMLERRGEIEREIESLGRADERVRELAAERANAVAAANEAAARLSRARTRAARKLARQVEGELADLAMAGARFVVSLEKRELEAGASEPGAEGSRPVGLETGPGGRERPEFRFSANEGEPPRPIQRIASGGELSRLFLAVKNALRRADRPMVLVFDEVDAGIGGAVAERVGRVLAELAQDHQVLCITHLPQIAAFGDRHFVVRKEVVRDTAADGGRTRTRVTEVRDEARVEELARMAGGEKVTDITREHARALLSS